MRVMTAADDDELQRVKHARLQAEIGAGWRSSTAAKASSWTGRVSPT